MKENKPEQPVPNLLLKSSQLITVQRWTGDMPIEKHCHNYIEIAFIAKGSCTHFHHDSQVMLIPGDIFVIKPLEEHFYKINSKTVIFNFIFYPKALGEDWALLCDIKSIYTLLISEPFLRNISVKQNILHLGPTEAASLEDLLKQMIEEQSLDYKGSALMQKSNLIKFLLLLGRAWDHQFSENATIFSEKRDRLTDVLLYIEKNISQEFKIEELAAKAFVSPNYFRKLFKEATGLTPVDYINKHRMASACNLLMTSDLTIAGISERIGICDVNYFSRLFKSMFGCSPSEYKIQIGKY